MSFDLHSVRPDLEALARLFHESTAALGEFHEVAVGQMPETYRRLLAHTHHMTVTTEQFHGSPVDVRVLAKRSTAEHYAREILLTRQTDHVVVQYGIMRIHWTYVTPEVRREIESEQQPLGRILIQHDILRSVQLYNLWQVATGPVLDRAFGLAAPSITYGRTALIEFDNDPAIELVEIVAPVIE